MLVNAVSSPLSPKFRGSSSLPEVKQRPGETYAEFLDRLFAPLRAKRAEAAKVEADKVRARQTEAFTAGLQNTLIANGFVK